MFNRTGALISLIAATLIAAVPSFAQVNIGFEKGTFDNWEFAIGTIQTNGDIVIYPSIAVPGSFTLLKKEQSGMRDFFGNFSVFPPNGSNYSMRLGNDLDGNSVQQISYTMTVPPAGSNSIIFDYAVVLENPGHELHQQPRFTVKIYNVTDKKYLDCPAFDFISSSGLPGFKFNGDSVYYKDWSTASINLTGLNSKKVRLEFTVNHCPFRVHSGYAYIDVNENISTPISGNSYCADQTAINLSAPPGFASYTWYTPDFKKLLGTGQFLTLTPPTDLTGLAVTVSPYNGLGCADTLYTTLNRIDGDLKFVAKETIIGCPGSAVDLTRGDITDGSSAGLRFDYLTDSLQALRSPDNITQGGLYYIRAVNAGGCSNLLPVRVTFELPRLKINNPPAVTYPLTADLSESFIPQQGVSYSYYKDEQISVPLADFTTVRTSGTYYVKAATAGGCTNVQPVTVTILPPEPFSVTAPNAFTPNNDGTNDHFLVSLKGYVSFGSLQIYNRNGTLIFSTADAARYWDGNHNGRPVTTGTYYWVFEGYDDYYHQKVNRSSYITLIR